MPERCWRIALIDSGVNANGPVNPVDACRFSDTGLTVSATPVLADRLGHGSLMVRIIGQCAAIELLNAQVFGASMSTTAAAVAAAIDWSVAQRADLLHLSLGLRENRAVLDGAVSKAIAAGCIVIASTPARGEMSYPARYPGVIRATGDARCSVEEISWLASPQADFGACPRFGAQHGAGGASVGAAYLTRFIVANLRPGFDTAHIRSELTKLARHRGPESRRE